MAASSARENESERLPPLAAQEGEALEETPTVITSSPLDLGDSSRSKGGNGSGSGVEIVGSRGASDVASTESLPTSLNGSSSSSIRRAERAGSGPAVLTEDRTVISKRPPITDLRLDQPYTPHELGQALVGKPLAHFQLEEFLGGGMGAVFRGRDLTLGRCVAVKVLPRGQDEDTIRRFKNEAQSAARLNHENIARVYYVGEEDGWNFIIFEHIEGVTVRRLVDARGPLPLEEAIHHTLQAAQALDHAYQRDVVHRDIKPSNLIVSTDGSTKLVDMGLARLHQVEASKNDLTASGVTLGTFDYISPEQARDPREADVRSDLYSLGCTLYFMLAGRPPFPDGTVLQKLLDHQSRQPPDLRVFRPDLPDTAVAVFNKMLAKQPEDRHQTPGELIADLTQVADQLGLDVGRSRQKVVAAPARPSFWENHLAWLAPTILLIVAVFLSEWIRRPARTDGDFAFPAIVAPTEKLADPPPHAGDPQVAARADANQNADADSEDESPAAPDEVEATVVSPRAAGSERASATAADRPPPSTRVEATSDSANDRSGSPPTPGEAASARHVAEAITGDRAAPRKEAAPRAASQRVAAPEGQASRQVRTVIVGPKGAMRDPLPENTVHVETADEALRQAALNQWPELEIIELRFTGVQAVKPVALARTHLTLRAAEDHTPVLAFEDNPRYALDKHMIRVQGGGLTLDGVQVRWRLPADRTPRDWALILLDDVAGVTLRDCVLTIENVDSSGFPQENGAAFFRLASSTLNQRALMQTSIPPPPAPEVVLSNCVVRGEANFLSASETEPFDLYWSQGLLATTGRLADLGGAPLARIGSARIKLDHVTVAAEDGLCRLASSEKAPHRLYLAVEADNCVFATDPQAPLIEHEMQNELSKFRQNSDWGRLLNWMGSNNARLQGAVAWRLDDLAEAAPLDFQPGDPAWNNLASVDAFADYELMWRNQAAWAPQVHDRTVEAYTHEVRRMPETEPPTDAPGFSAASLPTIYRVGTTH